MSGFPLKIVTPAGLQFDGTAQQLTLRTVAGDVTILPRHINYVAPLGMGEAVVIVDGARRSAACIGGMVSVVNGAVKLVPTSFEWAEDIDVPRAQASEERAHQVLENKDATDTDIRMAKARLKRALIRRNVAAHKPK